MATTTRDVQRGYGNEERPLIGELWQRDAVGQNVAMKACGDYEPRNKNVDYKRYYDTDYFKLEMERIWKKQWLYAAREEDIPEIGDRVPFHVGPLSFIITRSGPGEFKAFYNSCLHRGTMLCTKKESGSSIRCPSHAWEWGVDGRLKKIPSHWDFTELTRLNTSLPEVKLSCWGGFIFINVDAGAAPLEESLGVLPAHFQNYGLETRYTKARFRKLVSANWKTSQEAFQESYHVYATHPEAVPFTGDSQSQYDIFTTPHGAIGREAVPSVVPSMHADSTASAVAAGDAAAQAVGMWHYPDFPMPQLDPVKDVRAQVGAWMRAAFKQAHGRDYDGPDAALIDSTLYFMYPQACFWMSESVPFVYQFTPHATDPNLSYFEVRILVPYAEGQNRPPSSPLIEIGLGESIMEKASAFSFLGMIFDQDMSNMPLVQQGLKTADPAHPHSRLGSYQERLIQHWHELFDQQMAG